MREAASRGFFLSSKAPFRYKRVKVNDGSKERPTLVPDLDAAPIVREAFESSLKGNGLKEICRELRPGHHQQGLPLAQGRTTLPPHQRGLHRHRSLGQADQGRAEPRPGAGGERLACPGVQRSV